MSVDDEMSKNTAEAKVAAAEAADEEASEDGVMSRDEKILRAKELYSQGSRNYLVKCYSEAADQLSEVCALYDELYGEGCAELGMPYLLYAKSLIALAVDENKVLEVPDEADEDDEEDVDGEEEEAENAADAGTSAAAAAATSQTTTTATNGAEPAKKADSTAEKDNVAANDSSSTEKPAEVAQVSSSSKSGSDVAAAKNGDAAAAESSTSKTTAAVSDAAPVMDGEKPSTSNGDVDVGEGEGEGEDEEEDNEAVSNLRLAWEILELAAKIFSRQGLSGLPNLAEVQTELANIEFENNIMDAAREDYEKALKIYKELPKNYHRAMAEIHYKIGLTYLMQQLNKEGAASLKEACDLIEAEIAYIKTKDELTEKDKNNIQDMEETEQEIRAKIDEIEEAQAQNIAEVRAALDSYIKPIVSQNADDAGTSSSSSASTSKAAAAGSSSSSSSITSSSKPKDISHLIKRKKPEESNSEADASPAKRPAV